MDEVEFESLRRWGEALLDDPRDEVRAAGKAISLLAAEVERLQVELWHTRLGVERGGAEEGPTAELESAEVPQLEPALRGEVRSAIGKVASAAKRLQPDRLFHRS